MMTPRLLVLGSLCLAACHHQQPVAPAPAPARPAPQRNTAPQIKDGGDLLRTMRERYPSWYRTVTFTQTTTLYRPSGGELVQTWYEAASLPGKLRIDTDIDAKSGTLFARDSIFSVAAGKLVRADTGLNELSVLSFDAYTQPATRTAAQLRRLGFDLARMHEGTWNGRAIYVVGAARGDTNTKQFWVDQDNLLVVRVLERGPRGLVDTRFGNYVRLGGGWLATDVTQQVNGKPTLREVYSDPKTGIALNDVLFDARRWSEAVRLAKPGTVRDF